MSKADVNKLLPEMHIVDYNGNLQFFGDGGPGSPAYSAYQLATQIWVQEGVVKPSKETPRRCD